MKTLYRLMMTYAMMGIMMPEMYGNNKTLTPEELAEIKRVREKKALERKKSQGLKEWNIEGIEVVALNYKNAVRKANNIKELLNQKP